MSCFLQIWAVVRFRHRKIHDVFLGQLTQVYLGNSRKYFVLRQKRKFEIGVVVTSKWPPDPGGIEFSKWPPDPGEVGYFVWAPDMGVVETHKWPPDPVGTFEWTPDPGCCLGA